MLIRSFKVRLIVSVVCIIAAIQLGQAAINYQSMHALIRGELAANMMRTTEAVALEVDTWLRSRLHDVMATAALPAAKAVNTEGFSAIDKVNLERHKVFSKLFPEEFVDFYAANAKFTYHSVLERNGDISIFEGNLRGRPYYEDIMTGGPPQITEPLVSRSSKVPTLFVIAPITLEDKPQGLIGVGITLQFLQNRMQSFRYGKTGYGVVMDRKGTFISHPDPGLLATSYKDINPGARTLGEKMMTATSGTSEYVYKGVQKTGFYHPIPTTGWSLAFVINNEELYAPAKQALHMFMITALLSTVLAILAFLPIVRRMTAPIAELKRFAQDIAGGHFSPPPVQHADDEFMELAGSLGSMGTQLARLFSELDHTRDHLDKVLNAIPITLVSIDTRGKIATFNQAAQQTAECELLTGKRLRDCFPIPLELEKKIVLNVQQRRVFHIDKYRFEQADNTPRYVNVSTYPLQTGAGGVVKLEDITGRVQLEEMMLQSEKMLSVGNLAAGMAHEINNPLGGILQGAQNIFRRLDPSRPANNVAAEKLGIHLETLNAYLEERKINRMLEGIQDSASRAANIVSSMLSFSRKDHNTLSRYDLNELIDESVRLAESDYSLTHDFDVKRISIIRNYAKALPQVLCAKTEIEQVILNLIQNAAYAMVKREGVQKAPTIYLTTQRSDGHVVLTVEDNGPGMPENVRKRIFEPFFTTKKPGEGTGLGLAVAYFIITQNHGGDITVEERPAGGTKFTIRIPFERSESSPA